MEESSQVLTMMGTKIRLYFKGERAERWLTETGAMLKHYEQVFNANSDLSPLSALKQSAILEPVVINHDLYELIKTGRAHSLEPNIISDKVMDFFKEKNPVSAMIDIGGNLLVYGHSPKQTPDWDVGIQNPFLPRGHCIVSVKIRNQSVVTSGIYE